MLLEKQENFVKTKERLAVLFALVGMGLALIAMTLGSQEIEGKVAALVAFIFLLSSLFLAVHEIYETLNAPLKVQVLLRGVGKREQNFKAWVYLDRRTGRSFAPTTEKELRLEGVLFQSEVVGSKLLGAPYWRVVDEDENSLKLKILGENYSA